MAKTAYCFRSVSVACAFPTNKSCHLGLLGLSRTFHFASVGRKRKETRERIKGKGRLEGRRRGGREKKTCRKSCTIPLDPGKLRMWNWMKHGRLVCPPLSFQVKGFFGCLAVTIFFSIFTLGEQCGVLGGAAIFMGDIDRSFCPTLVCRSHSGASWELGSIDVLSKNSTDYRTDFPISRAIFNSLPTTAASL